MKFLFISLIGLLFFTSCETLTGDFTSLGDVVLKDSKGKSVVISEGVYLESKVKLKSKKKLKLIVDGKTYEFKIPKGARIPTDNGSIELTSDQVGQAYDVSGNINTEVNHGNVERSREACDWQEPYSVCTVDSNGRRVCRTEYRRRYGWKDVQFHYDEIDKHLSVSLVLPPSNIESAIFIGNQRYYKKVIEYEGRCF